MQSPRTRNRDVRSDVLAGARGTERQRALTLNDVPGALGDEMRDHLAGVLIPTSAVLFFAVTPNERDWLPADGSAVSRATYVSLFATIGTTFGAGDGSTTFNLPTVASHSGMTAFIKT